MSAVPVVMSVLMPTTNHDGPPNRSWIAISVAPSLGFDDVGVQHRGHRAADEPGRDAVVVGCTAIWL